MHPDSFTGPQLILGIIISLILVFIFSRNYKKPTMSKNPKEREKQRMLRHLKVIHSQLSRTLARYRDSKSILLQDSYEELIKQQFYLTTVMQLLEEQAYGIYNYPEYEPVIEEYNKLQFKTHNLVSRTTYNEPDLTTGTSSYDLIDEKSTQDLIEKQRRTWAEQVLNPTNKTDTIKIRENVEYTKETALENWNHEFKKPASTGGSEKQFPIEGTQSGRFTGDLSQIPKSPDDTPAKYRNHR